MRNKQLLNEGWQFIKQDLSPEEIAAASATEQTIAAEQVVTPVLRAESAFMPIRLPHTWNALDGQDGGNDYYRGRCWYRRVLATPEDLGTDLLFLDFGGVNSIAEVWVNGTKAAAHEGGFARFRVNLTPYLLPAGGENVILVSADNGENDRVYPQFADFTFFGGIYRDVNLIRVPKSHFDLHYYGSEGFVVTATPEGEDARLDIRVFLDDACPGQFLQLRVTGENAPQIPGMTLAGGAAEIRFTAKIEGAHRWNGRKDPYLYKLEAILSENGAELDRVGTEFGVREFSVDPEKGFFLNGESYPLRGVCRHQDRQDMGWAITRAEHEEDLALILEVGANTIRLAHYQHDEYFYQLCDRAGLILWAEIPFISRMLENGHANELQQLRELIVQNVNHPSIICWGLSNEITIGCEAGEEMLRRHRELNELAHRLDPTRLTTMAQVSMLPIDSPMNELSDLRSYNIYYGWYGGSVEDNGPFIDSFHAAHPDLPLGISEYGCEAILCWHSDKPEQGDYSEEYQAFYHEKLLETLMSRPFLWATHLWNMFDFAVDMREEGGFAGKNHKGLVTHDRKTKKDSFYIYKAWWSDEPFVHVCGRRFEKRAGKTTAVKVYSNQPEVELFANGRSLGKKTGSKVFVFENVPLRLLGRTVITARAGECSDEIGLRRVRKPFDGYRLDAQAGQVDNWFDSKLEFPEGYFSIKDKISDIVKTPEGKALFDELSVGLAAQMGDGMPKMDDSLMRMVGSFTIQRIAKMAGDKFPKEALVSLNEKLNKIKK